MSITRQDIRVFRTEIDHLLATFCQKYNLEMTQNAASFTNTSFSVKLEFVEKVENEAGINVNNPEAKAYLINGHTYGLLPGRLGVTFVSNGDGTEYIFVGIKPQRYQYPFSVERASDGKKFKMGKSVAQNINAGTVK